MLFLSCPLCHVACRMEFEDFLGILLTSDVIWQRCQGNGYLGHDDSADDAETTRDRFYQDRSWRDKTRRDETNMQSVDNLMRIGEIKKIAAELNKILLKKYELNAKNLVKIYHRSLIEIPILIKS